MIFVVGQPIWRLSRYLMDRKTAAMADETKTTEQNEPAAEAVEIESPMAEAEVDEVFHRGEYAVGRVELMILPNSLIFNQN